MVEMIIIGEKLNGTIKSVREAIANRDSEFIRNLAIRQAQAGCDYLDVCAGTGQNVEVDTLKWMVDIVEAAVETPICIDSPNPHTLAQLIPYLKKPGLINSVSGEGAKCEILYPLAREYGFDVIALTLDDAGIPKTSEHRIEIACNLVEKASRYGLGPERLYIDPLVIAVSTANSSVFHFVQTMRAIREKFPGVKITSGLSNISFGLPLRKLVNRNFLCLAMYEGMDSAILDPTDKEIKGTLFAVDVLVAKDKNCRKFTSAFRKGEL
jgi:5-methyltetrahydrofolate--homocysteine methyltransferase